MIMKQPINWLLAMGLLLPAIGCTYKKELTNATSNDCSAVPGSFSADIMPILQSSCAINSGCHAAGSVSGPGPLTNYIQVQGAAADIKFAVQTRLMPLGSTLSNADIQKISCWVSAGAPNN